MQNHYTESLRLFVTHFTYHLIKSKCMKAKITFLLLGMLMLFSGKMYSQFDAQHPDLRLCGSAPNYYLDAFNCTSNNFTLDQVFLSLTNVNGQPMTNTTCTIGQTQSVYIMLNYTSNASNTPNNGRLFADLMIDDTLIPINAYLGEIAPGANQRQIYGPFNWTCGQELSLSRILVVWRTGGGAAQLPSYNCGTYSSSQCELPGNTIIAKPLAVQFSYKACRVGNNTTVNFTSTTNGGFPGYTYAWDFDNNGTTDSTLANPIFTFTGAGPWTVKLTATDSHGLSNSFTQTITSPSELSVSASPTHVGCGGGSNGAIDLSVSGGTPGYSYSWTGGATTQDLANLSPGTYTVTVTDANGCQKVLPVTINGGDAVAPVVTAPANVMIEGCNSLIIGSAGHPAYSSVQVTVTLAQFQALGGSYTDGSTISTVTYQDVQTGSCPKTITRTWRLTDFCGNVGTAVQTFTIKDTTAPVFQPLTAVVEISCPATPVFEAAKAVDACDNFPVLTFVDVTTPGACAGSYSITRTWTATDACGNASTASQTINVKDTSAPVIAALPAPTTIDCPATPQFATATATDGCNSAFTLTFNDVTTPGACAGSYTVTRTWTAIDGCNNTATASQTITVRDISAPTISALPGLSTITCPATPSFSTPTATDSCGTATLTFVDVTTPGSCGGSYSVTRTWTATDACGNTANASQTIAVQDNAGPVIATLPAPSTISCPATPQFATATATDACGGTVNLTFNDVTTNGTCAGSYSVTRTWTATDTCGNTSTASQTITVTDTTAPVIAALPAPSTISCPATPQFATATATDACGSTFTLTFDDVTANGACAGNYSVTRTWTATDSCGNTSTASQTINVTDTTAPVIAALPAPSTISCPATPQFATATATDACGSTFTLTFNDVTTNGACAGSYSTTRTWTATDACGNTATASQTINVQDTTAPVIAALPAPSAISCPATPQFATATATDACGSTFTLTFNDVTTNGTCAGSYSTTRTWTATDSCGNTSTASQTITVQDTTAPVIAALPAPSTISCPAAPEFATATATDACGSTFTLTFNDVTTNGTCAGSYSTTRTWTATDSCGNTSTASQTITVADTTAPVIAALPEPSTISCPATPSFATATATDACGSTFTLTFNDVTTNGACAGSYSTTRTWTATDSCGNTSTASQTITVTDTTDPVIAALPAPATINCPATPQFATATATDACGSTFTLTFNDVTTNGTCAGSYSTTRTWTATDACGNTSTASQTITVQDITAPVIATPASNLVVQCDGSGNTTALNDWLADHGGAVATDACSEVVWTNNFNALANDCSAAVTVIFTATDACGNHATTSATFSVQDITAPVAPSAPTAVTVACAADVPANISLTATDNCAGAITVEGVDAVTPGACVNSFVVTRTWTFTDACNNTSSVSQTITVNDNVAPVAPSAPAAVTVACAADVPVMISLTANDNCSGAITVEGSDSIAAGQCVNSFVITRTWTFTDACNNTSSVSQTITVNDNIAPVAPSAPEAVTAACAAEVPAMISLTATDNCTGEITVEGSDSIAAGSCANAYVITRTWTFTDACNNTSSVSQTITVNDNVAPVIAELPGASTISCPATPEFAQATATDNCAGQVSLTFADVTTNGQCAGSYAVTRTWTATDICGNTATATQTINVEDTTAPVIAELPAVSTINCPATPEFIQATATDACQSAITLTHADVTTEGQCAGSYSVTRTWTATDACGNASTATQTINIQDVTPPVINTEATNLVVECDGSGSQNALQNWLNSNGGATATDACSNVVWTNNFNNLSNDCSTAVTVIFTATDACGNAASTSATFTVQDTTAPVAPTAPEAVTVSCEGEVPAAATLTAIDNCAGEVIGVSADVVTPGQCANSYIITRTWTFTDACANISTVSQTITVNDTVAPVAPAAPADVTVVCTTDIPTTVTLTATDNCGTEITAEGVDTTVQGACAGSFVVTRTWTFTDACGNISSVSQTITVADTVAPVAPQAPANVTLACGSEVPAMVSLTATDNCGDQITVEGVDSTVAGQCANSFVTTRTWTFTDACGNESSVSQIITVSDTVAPVVPQAPADITLSCGGEVPAMVSLTATDNCGTEITVEGIDTTVDGQCAGSFVTTRTWTFTDACGNTSSVSQVITVADLIAPIVPEAPADVTVSCGGEIPAMVSLTATDNCGAVITVEGVDTTVQGSCVNSYVVTRTWTFTDNCGNTSTASQTITVADETAPVVENKVPADVTVPCTGEIPPMSQLTATDNCGEIITVDGVDVTTPGSCPNTYVVTRTWTFTDACGNTSTAVQVITVNDTVPPTFNETVPEDISVSCDAVPAAVTLTASDNCNGGATVVMTESTSAGNCAGAYTLTRTWTATDACGNTTVAEQDIAVTDIIAPTFNEAVPTDITVECDAIPTAPVLTANDNCGTATVAMTESTVAGSCAGSYTLTRTWTATDLCGNPTVGTQIITVIDTTAPFVVEPFETVVETSCGTIPAAPELTFGDNCSGVGTPTFDESIINQTAGGYTIIRTWTIADGCGNVGTFTQTVNVTIANNVILVSEEACFRDPSQWNLNDYIPVGTETTGTWTEVNGTGHLINGNFFVAENLPLAVYTFEIAVNDPDCPRVIRMEFEVNDEICPVLPCDLVVIHNAFSPNGDGLNEFFSLENIEDSCYIYNKVEIYNRWGVLVYDTEMYNNADNSFKGISEGRATVAKDSALPTGTYFYIVEWRSEDGLVTKKDGYLYLSR
jgi:gliding motility-associated-like protein